MKHAYSDGVRIRGTVGKKKVVDPCLSLWLFYLTINGGTAVVFFWFFYLISRYMQRTRAMAAACRCPSRGKQPFPPVYPFPTPGPARAVIVGVSPRSPSPQSA